MSEYTPDNWVVVKYKGDDHTTAFLLAGLAGISTEIVGV